MAPQDAQDRDARAFAEAVRRGDLARVEGLLQLPAVRERLNDALFDFGQRATHVAAKNPPLLEVLIAAGADVNLASDWPNGPYTVLDNADEESARFLLSRGARLTPNVAARLGWLAALTEMVDAVPSLVHTRGGDGQQPLHEATTVAIADFLVDRGAGLDVRCIDHRSTPAQYALVDRPDVCRRLLDRGATPDIFMAARLGDAVLAARLIDEDPACVAARINAAGYALVPPMHIYCWTLGFGLSAQEVAHRFAATEVHDLLAARSSPRERFLTAMSLGDRTVADQARAADPALVASLTREEHGRLALAIFHERFTAAETMLDAGLDPAAPGVDGGTALHAACWVGHLGLVDRLVADGGVALDARDPTHQSTPLGWTAFGSVHRRARGADYPAVAARLVAGGANIALPGNGEGLSLLDMARGNEEMRDALRRLGAT